MFTQLLFDSKDVENLLVKICDDDGFAPEEIIQIVECFVDAMNLKSKIYGDDDDCRKEYQYKIGDLLVSKINDWFLKIDNKYFRSLISLISKIIETCDTISVIDKLWNIILNNNSIEESLTLFCALTDDFFTQKSSKVIDINISNINDERYWSIIKFGLTSNVQQQRKQAQHIMKTTIEFINNNKTYLNDLTTLIIPFINQSDKSISLELSTDFFLLLESLEEKQSHLVLPAFSRLESLISSSHLFNSIWLKIIFQRIFHHDTTIVVKSGLLIMLNIDPIIFNNEFIELLVTVLNSTFLYDEQSFNPQSEITQKLTNIFIKAEHSKINFINDFIIYLSKIQFLAPVPLFWIIEGLRGLKDTPINTNYWSQRELQALTIIFNNGILKQTKEIRELTMSSLSKCFLIFTKQTIDLKILSETFLLNDYYFLTDKNNDDFLEYIRNNITQDDAVDYVKNNCENIIENNDKLSIELFGKMIYLLLKCHKILTTKTCPTKNILNNLFKELIDIDTRSYANINYCENSLNLLGYLNTKNLFGNNAYVDGALKFIIKTLDNSICPKNHSDVFVNVKNIEKLFDNNLFNDLFVGIEKLFLKSIDVINGHDVENVKFWYAVCVLFECGKSIDVKKKYFNDFYCDFLLNLCQKSLITNKMSKDDARFISEYHGIIAKLIEQLFNYFTIKDEEKINDYLGSLMNLIETGSDHVIPSIPKILLVLMQQDNSINNDDNYDIIKSIVELTWKRTLNMKRTKLFWLSIEEIIGLITNDKFPETDASCYVNELLEASENIPKLRLILLKSIKKLKPSSKYKFSDSILTCYLHTNIGKIEKRIERQIFRYACNYFTSISPPPEMLVHYHAIEEILSMSSWNPDAVNLSYIPVLLLHLVKRKNKGYYANSNTHILNNRIMQILLILQPTLDDDSTLTVHEAICDHLLEESNQPSVRVMQEWLIIKIHLIKPKLREQFWNLFAKGRDNRPASITSLASIIYHVLKNLPSHEKNGYFEKAIDFILPNCMTQQFVVRLYCQVVLSKLCQIANEEKWILNFECNAIKNSLEISLRQGNLMKNSLKLLDDFYFTTFDPIEDYDFQTIFYDIPRLLNVSLDECINETIVSYCSWNEKISLPYSRRNYLSSICTPSQWQEKDNNKTNDGHYTSTVSNNDIQKKITPTKSVDFIDDMQIITPTYKQKIIDNDMGMIVVASLIDSYQNLGGLSRTCEIFCARQLILSSAKNIENKEFQCLSVSSEKWVNIVEIKTHELRDYLMEKKLNGWSLIGAEQTANSVSLKNISFPKKTILLLGNEKNGIPANLIPLLDMCVEIPQAGVVRSLNVHVTGAICLWDYAKQHIFVKDY
ncbi:uncharacterized protein LOC122847791 [Aphidius gifuensis]|uniref:uncharacterized protein LOC122847791 n=1 Tax=Aphidius gifuensis TaxID=684658 RepID=UPI001CDD2218|nr:uncharacterized protein LOC122847791 [Aphidius gifuensis]